MKSDSSYTIDTTQRKLGPIWLSPGVKPKNVLTMFYSAAMAIGFINLLNLIQPLLLQDLLGMTSGEGNFTAIMYVVLEITTLVCAAPLANLSDQIGRRPIFTSGFIMIFVAMIFIPTARTGLELGAYRIVASVGIACCTTMIASLMADYPQNASRGKYIGINGFCTAVGVIIIGSGLTQMPKVFSGMGYSAIESISYTLWIGSALAFITAVVTFAGIKKGLTTKQTQKLPFIENAKAGLAAIAKNPRLILGCGATLMSRGDLVVLATFFSLWVQKLGADKGLESVAASATAGQLFGLMQIAMLFSLPVIAALADKYNRVTILALGMALAAIGYLALGVAPDPFESNIIYLVCVLAGIGEAGMIVAVPALIGQEAPEQTRGAVIGVAATFGAIGVLATNWVAGALFDNLSYKAPFLFMCALNVFMLIWALIVRFSTTDSPEPIIANEN